MKRGASIQDIEQLRALRVRPSPDLAMTSNLDAIAKSIAAEQRTIRRAEAALSSDRSSLATLPEYLRGMCSSAQLSRGTLTIRVAHAAGMHALAAWLRSGGEAALCTNLSGVKRVKVRVG